MPTQSNPSKTRSQTDGKDYSTPETALARRADQINDNNRTLKAAEPSRLAESVTNLPPPCRISNPERDAFLDNLESEKKADHARHLLSASGVPRKHVKMYGKCEKDGEWAVKKNALLGMSGSGFIALLTGSRGSGKTQMVVDLIVESCKSQKSAVYIKAMGFFLEVRETYGSKNKSERQVIEQFKRPGLLVIDEVHTRGESKWEDNLLTHLIDLRYDDGSDTILISNLSKDSFVKSVGSSIADRARESGGVVVCDWPSFRSPHHAD